MPRVSAIALVLAAGCTTDIEFFVDRVAVPGTEWVEISISEDEPPRLNVNWDAPDGDRMRFRIVGDSSKLELRAQAFENEDGDALGAAGPIPARDGALLCLRPPGAGCTQADPQTCECADAPGCNAETSLAACASPESQCLITNLEGGSASGYAVAVDDEYLFFARTREILSRRNLATDEVVDLSDGLTQDPRLAVDANYVYWSSYDDGVKRVGRLGGDTETVLDVLVHPSDIAVDEQYIYAVLPETGVVTMADKTSGLQRRDLPNHMRPEAIALDDSHVYWINYGHPGAETGQLFRAKKGELGSATEVYGNLSEPTVLDVSANAVVWGNKAGVLWSADKDGGAFRELAVVEGEPTALKILGDFVYVSGQPGLVKVSLQDGGITELDRRDTLGLTVNCSGAYADLWYEDTIIRYGK